jgi:hypothetical protein
VTLRSGSRRVFEIETSCNEMCNQPAVAQASGMTSTEVYSVAHPMFVQVSGLSGAQARYAA